MTDLDAILSKAKLPERTVSLCLRGDLQAEFEALERQLAQAHEEASDTLGGNPRAKALARRINDLREEMSEAVVEFRMRGMGHTSWHNLVLAHEPREGKDEDQMLGYNPETFWPALVKASVVSPEVTDEQWARLIGGTVTDGDARREVDGVLTSKQYDDLLQAALNLNRRTVDVPFSYAASAMLQGSGRKSKRRSGSESRSSGSEGGSRRRSRGGSTTTTEG